MIHFTGDTTPSFVLRLWQQSDCDREETLRLNNPSGCLSDLYPYVIHELHQLFPDPANSGAIDGQRRRQTPWPSITWAGR